MWYIKCLGAHASEGPFGVSFISSMDNPPLGRVEKQCKAKTKWYTYQVAHGIGRKNLKI